jgi:hypothetical protein
MKNKYLVFLYGDYYPLGGLKDFIGGVAELSEVSDLIRSNTGHGKDLHFEAGEDKRLAYSGLNCNILCVETGDFLTLDRLGGEFRKAGSILDGFVDSECDSEATKDYKAFEPPAPPTHAWSALTGDQVPIYQPGKGRQAGRVTISGKDLNILRRARVKSDAEMQEIIKNLSGIDP